VVPREIREYVLVSRGHLPAQSGAYKCGALYHPHFYDGGVNVLSASVCLAAAFTEAPVVLRLHMVCHLHLFSFSFFFFFGIASKMGSVGV
jgi:hypothetical protein